ncbi:MAG TPA: hypothetical protein VIS52_08040 [Motiliproteus sp.]
MTIEIEADDKASQLLGVVKSAPLGAEIHCRLERQYGILKIALVKLQRDDLSVVLQDSAGRVLRQVTARKRTQAEVHNPDALSQSQLAAAKELERAFRRCKEVKLRLVGFSDSLVAVPEHLGCGADVLSSPDALELDTHDAYHGFDDEL